MGGLKLGKEAQAKFDEAREKPDHSGWLEKKGAKRKNWNKRWFVLKDNYLFYCKGKTTPPQGIINLHGCNVNVTEGPTNRPNSFSVMAPKSVSVDAKWTNRTYHIAGTSVEDLQTWLNVLQAAAGKKNAAKPAAATTTTGKTETPKKADSDSDNEKPTKEGTKDEASSSEEDEKK